MKSLKMTKWLLLITGILVTILGISMLFTPFANIMSLAILIGIIMLLSGISELVSFFVVDREYRSGWILASGAISLLFGIWLLFGKGLPALAIMIPFVFAGWVIAAGVTRAIGAFSLKSAGVRNWGWMLVFGIINVLMGVLLMYSPWLSALLISNLIAFAFISHGINSIVGFFSMNRIGKYFRQCKE